MVVAVTGARNKDGEKGKQNQGRTPWWISDGDWRKEKRPEKF